MDVYASENCHRCGVIEKIGHDLVECPVVCHFWNQVQVFIDKVTGGGSHYQNKAPGMDPGRWYSAIKECK